MPVTRSQMSSLDMVDKCRESVTVGGTSRETGSGVGGDKFRTDKQTNTQIRTKLDGLRQTNSTKQTDKQTETTPKSMRLNRLKGFEYIGRMSQRGTRWTQAEYVFLFECYWIAFLAQTH